jgi:hypothetical protein
VCWWSSVSSTALKAAGLDSKRLMMNECRMVTLSGIVAALTASLARSMLLSFFIKMRWWKMAATTSQACATVHATGPIYAPDSLLGVWVRHPGLGDVCWSEVGAHGPGMATPFMNIIGDAMRQLC